MSAVTEGRKTFVTFRDYLPGATQGWIAIQRTSDEMARSQNAAITFMVNLPHIGWTLTDQTLRPGDSTWLTASQSGQLGPTQGASVPPHFEAPDTFAQQNITGVTYAPSVQVQGTPMIVARPPAGTDWSTLNLAADQAAFPSPATSEDYTPMNRVLVTTNGMADPGDDLVFAWYFPGSAITPRGTIGSAGFCGPAGDAIPSDSNNPGTGQYFIKLRGDKYAYVYEKMRGGTWLQRFSFLWGDPSSPLSWTLVQINISTRMWQDANGNWQGDRISFSQSAGNVSPSQMAAIKTMTQLSSTTLRFQKGLVSTYNVPRQTLQPQTICAVRVDMAIDVRGMFMPSKHVYQPTGTLTDDSFTFDQPVPEGEVLGLSWSGVKPTDCSWDAQLYDQNGNACTPTGAEGQFVTAQGVTSFKYFTATTNYGSNILMTGGYIKFTLNSSSDQFKKPILTDWSIYSPPIYQTTSPVTPVTIPFRVAPPSLWSQVIESVSIMPQTTDPGSENGTIVITDYTGALDSFLEYVNFIPIHVWVFDPSLVSNPSQLPVTIFRGYILRADGERFRTQNGQTYPNPLWTRWTCQCVGEWARAEDATLPRRQIWQDQSTGLNSLVTDAVRNMAQSVYPPSMVVVPDGPVRLFGTDPSTWTTEPGMRVSDLDKDWMNDYYGGWIQYDEGVGVTGALRGFYQKTPPYNNLAAFEIDHPTIIAGDSKPRLPHVLAAYGYTTSGNGQIVQHAFAQAETFHPHTERAEANCVIVFGGGCGPDAQQAGGSDAFAFSQIAINTQSSNFLNLPNGSSGAPAGNDPAYFGRLIAIRVYNYSLPTQAAVNYYCRRIYDKTCFARYYITFMAPLLFVNDITDPYQTYPRKLRYSDPVLFRQYDGSYGQFLVFSCQPAYTKDNIQMAHYILVTQQNINERAVVPMSSSALQQLKKVQTRLRGIDMSQSSDNYTFQKQGGHINSEVMGLPTSSGLPIQDLNPTSPTFGKFYTMSNYYGPSDVIR